MIKRTMRNVVRAAGAIASGAIMWSGACSACAGVLWNESIHGDLSNSQAAPRAFTLALGVNSFIGAVGGTESQDWVALTVPAGMQLTSDVLAAYAGTDQQGFTGFQTGATFVGSAGTASSYRGYAHYGTGATNGALPPTNLIGANLLPLMANPSLAAGSQGFTPPLGPGTYTFLFQQTGGSISYQFDFTVVPEPGAGSLLGLGAAVLAGAGISRRKNGGSWAP